MKDIPMKVQEAYRTPNRLAQKKYPNNIIIKMQNIQNKERKELLRKMFK